MKVGITGSKGFIGKHLVSFFLKKGFKVSECDLPEYDLLKINDCSKFVANKDVIIHTAAVNRGSDDKIITSSIVVTYNLIEAVKKKKRKVKLIFLSSSQAETETVYGLSKRLTEIMLKSFSKNYKIPVTVLRVTNVFGEGCQPFYNSVVATFSYQVANNKKITVLKDNKLNLIYIKDLVKIILKEAKTKRKDLFYFKEIKTKNIITVKKLAQLINSFKKNKPLKNKFEKDLYNTFNEQKTRN